MNFIYVGAKDYNLIESLRTYKGKIIVHKTFPDEYYPNSKQIDTFMCKLSSLEMFKTHISEFITKNNINPSNLCVVVNDILKDATRPILDEYILPWMTEVTLVVLNIIKEFNLLKCLFIFPLKTNIFFHDYNKVTNVLEITQIALEQTIDFYCRENGVVYTIINKECDSAVDKNFKIIVEKLFWKDYKLLKNNRLGYFIGKEYLKITRLEECRQRINKLFDISDN